MSELKLRLAGTDASAVIPEIEWQGERRAGEAVDLRLSGDDVADLWWLLEDPMVDWYDPGTGRRGRAEQAVERIGYRLGQAFTANEELRRLLALAIAPAQQTVVLIASASEEMLALPWELARLPDGRLLTNLAQGFARQRENVQATLIKPREEQGLLRVLLVVARPAAEEDVEYQAIAAKLLDRLEGRAKLKLVRPGTFQAMERELGRDEYDLVHYDGHGTAGRLAFEDGPVEAERLGRVLVSAGVAVFALNACQSAVAGGRAGEMARTSASVAQALVGTGAAAVVAMGASVRVVSAVTFFDRFYEELARGRRLSEACQLARRGMEAGPGVEQGRLDWAIPVLYLREDQEPFAGRAGTARGALEILQDAVMGKSVTPAGKMMRGPFVGRDGDLYRVDRAVDDHPLVLVYGIAGIGKTTLVEYLLNWRKRTGGADRVVSFSFRLAPSLEELARALEEEVVATSPQAAALFRGPQWQGTPLGERLVALGQALAAPDEGTRLLLFDNIETLSGYPAVGAGPYSDEDRKHVQLLLAALEGKRNRVLLTSRRDEAQFLGATVCRSHLGGVNGAYRLDMLQAWAVMFGVERRLREAWRDERQQVALGELLRALDGHPLATRVAAYGLKDRTLSDVLTSIQGQAGRIEVPVEERSMRSDSLEQVLAGTLAHVPAEGRLALGLLGLFAGRFHETDLFNLVRHEKFPTGVRLDRSEEALRNLLREAARLGLVDTSEEIKGVWTLVPGAEAALDRLWRESLEEPVAEALERHFLLYWAATAADYDQRLETGGQAEQAVFWAKVDEGNLRQALALGEKYREWSLAQVLLQLLLTVWPMAGRVKDADYLRDRWLSLVSDSTGNPRDGENSEIVGLWRFLLGNRATSLLNSGDLDAAWAIHRKLLDGLLVKPAENQQDIAAAYHQLGMVEQERGNLDKAEEWYRKSLDIELELGNRSGLASSYHQLGTVELERGNLDQAEEWYRKGLEIRVELGNRPDLASSYHQLGVVEQDRGNLDQAEEWYRKSLDIEVELGNLPGLASSYHHLGIVEQERRNLDQAEEWYRKSLEISAELSNRPGLASSYHQLGTVELERGNLDQAKEWYSKSLEIRQALNDRPEMAKTYIQVGRLSLALGSDRDSLKATLAALDLLAALGLPDARIAFSDLNSLYCRIGQERFTELWREVSGPPDLLKEVLETFRCEENEQDPPSRSQ